MRFAKGTSKPCFRFRHGYEMDVIRHQTPGPYFNSAFLAPFGQQADIGIIIVRDEKGLLAAIAALGDMVGYSRHYYSGYSGHGRIVTVSNSKSIEYTVP